MKGGGTHGVGAGQITDDSEMGLCLMWGLVASEKEDGIATMDLMKICECYKLWLKSHPFDIGFTTKNALDPMNRPENQKNLVLAAKSVAYQDNINSKSNGCLMRCNSIGVWGQHLSKEDLRMACRADTEITHSNQISFDVCYIHNLAIKYLLNSKLDDPVKKSKEVVDLCF